MERFRVRKVLKQFFELVRAEWSTFWYATLGAILMSFSLIALVVPYRFAGSGLGGAALLTRYIFNVSPAWTIAIGNLLLLSWGWRVLSPRFVLWTLYVSMLSSGAVAFFELFHYPVLGNTFLAALLGGVISGIGVGVVFRVGGSTGGTDVIVAAARKRWGVDMGMFSFYINTAILLVSWIAVDLEQLLMGGVLLYVESVTIDSVLKSFDRRKQVTVITSKMEDVKRYIVENMGKGATIIRGEGAYTAEERSMIIVVLNRRQAMELKLFTVAVDSKAFIIMADVAEVVGEGFKHWKNL